jgi:plasmid stabilization system protein ParE
MPSSPSVKGWVGSRYEALRDDIRPGLRLTHFRKRTTVAYTVNHDRVAILGVFHGGQDVEATLAVDVTE